MNIEYLNSLPEIGNDYNVDLQDDEKVVFNVELEMLGTQNDQLLGIGPKITLTNQRIIANNRAGIWTVDISEDIISCERIESGKWIFKSCYLLISLNKEIMFDSGKQKLTGFRFYFKKSDTAKLQELEDIMNHL